jgi:hypothetical protein
MKRRTAFSLLVGTPALALAATDTIDAIPDPEERRLTKLVRESPKIHLPELREYLRKKLDIAQEIALAAALDEKHRGAIEQAQKKWLEFYEAQTVVAGYNAEGGSYAGQAALEEGIHHLRCRIYTLVTPFLQGWTAAPFTPELTKP